MTKARKTTPLIGVVSGASVGDGLKLAGALTINLTGKLGELEAIQHLDGLVLTGGGDIAPHNYTKDPVHTAVYGVNPYRDTVELAMVKEARTHKIPMMGICRGSQLINVAYGGTLWQDMPQGDHWGEDRWLKIHSKSRLSRFLGQFLLPQTSHYHHQAVRQVGDGLRPIAWASDGTIEAIESVQGADTYVLGTQFHPEMDYMMDDLNFEIFRLFATEVAARRSGRRKLSATDRTKLVEDTLPKTIIQTSIYGGGYTRTGYKMDDLDWDDPWKDAGSELDITPRIYDPVWGWLDKDDADAVDEWDYFDYTSEKWRDGEAISDTEAQASCDIVCEGQSSCPAPRECLGLGDCLAAAVSRQAVVTLKRGNPRGGSK